jgi:hypothetical protein
VELETVVGDTGAIEHKNHVSITAYNMQSSQAAQG